MRSHWQSNCEIKYDRRDKRSVMLAVGVFFALFFTWNFLFLIPARAQSSVLDLNAAISARKKEQEALQRKIEKYQSEIRATQKKAVTLINQINILEVGIKRAELEIKNKDLESQQLALEIEVVERAIKNEEARQYATLDDIGAILRKVRTFDDRKYITIILADRSFSEVFNQLFYTERLAGRLKDKLGAIKEVRDLLTNNENLLRDKRKAAEEMHTELSILSESFSGEKRVKEALFGKTKSSEAEFQALLKELRSAAAAIDSEIVTLEKKIRERLDLAERLAGDTGLLSWPVSPIGGISASFHDPEYPFRYLFEHSGADIRAKQGTPVRAAASGYVARAFHGGMGVSPSYVMLVHANDITTVYMHLSQINVAADTFIARGDIIGLSGGAPNTPGAGRWSTGPHLHFETRLAGVPADPVGYLP